MNAKNEYSVFLVDDNKVFLTSLKNSLQERFGTILKISEFGTGEECIKHIDNNTDIVFLDYYLNSGGHPDSMNGIKVLGEIKSISKDITVIMLSGQDKLQVAIDSIKNGAYDYIAKSESAFIRVQKAVTNVIGNISSEKKSSKYFKLNIIMAVVIISIILIDIIWYSTSK